MAAQRRYMDDEPEWEDDQQEWQPEDEPGDTMPCPYCQREIYEDTLRCPGCGNYLSREDEPSPRKPWWIILGTILVLYMVYRWIVP